MPISSSTGCTCQYSFLSSTCIQKGTSSKSIESYFNVMRIQYCDMCWTLIRRMLRQSRNFLVYIVQAIRSSFRLRSFEYVVRRRISANYSGSAWHKLFARVFLYSFQSEQKSDAPKDTDAPAAAPAPQVMSLLVSLLFRFFCTLHSQR